MSRWVPLLLCVVIAGCATSPPVLPEAAGPGAAITGIVVGADGRPLEGVRVVLQEQQGLSPAVTVAADPMVLTDARGWFSFDAPRAVRHQLLLLHPTLGWLIAQGASTGPSFQLVFDGKVRVVDVTRRR